MPSRTCVNRISIAQQKTPSARNRCRHNTAAVRSIRQELIEQTRQLMEQTICFVPHPSYARTTYEQQLEKLRPASLDDQFDAEIQRPGVAFVTGLVKARLLTKDEERYLFLRLNFLKSRAERNRHKLDLRHPDDSLIQKIQADLNLANETRNRIVVGNVRLVVALARNLAGTIDLMTDLIGEGMPPLIRSVELFDVHLENRFSTYATWAVRNQMLRWLKRKRTQQEASLGESSPSLENLPDRRSIPESSEAAQTSRLSTVQALLKSLSERERAIVTARFGLEGQPSGQSLADISREIGLSKERVRQILLQSLSRLRHLISVDEIDLMD